MTDDKGFLELFKLDQSTLKEIVASFYLPDRTTINPYFMWSLYSLYRWYLTWMKNI